MKYLPPTDEDIERGVKYVFQISLRSNDFPGGIVVNFEDEPMWQFKTEPPRHAWSPLNLLGKPAFVLLDRATREVLRIRRHKRIPPCFEIVQDAEVLGKVRRLGIVSYRVQLVGGPTWTFRMPPFTHLFCARSNTSIRVWVRVVYSEMNWVLLVPPEADDPRLVVGLAFIHRERYAYT